MIDLSEITTDELNRFRSSLSVFSETMQSINKQFKEVWKQALPALRVIAECFKTLPERSRIALLQLGEHGWYLDPNIPATALFNLAEAFSDESENNADCVLCKWIEGHLHETEIILAKRFPNRKHVFREAFEAHNQKLYAAAIPLFLAQADGICKQFYGVNLFKKLRSGKMAMKERVDRLELDGYAKVMLAPLLEPLPIVANAKERLQLGNHLNRHSILHGENVNYGTHENSCRAISLLGYVSWVLTDSNITGIGPT